MEIIKTDKRMVMELDKKNLKIGEVRQIDTENISANATVVDVREVETPEQKGLMVTFDVEDYGETNPFYIRDEQILAAQTKYRQSRSGIPMEYVYKYGRDFDWSVYGTDVSAQKKVANAFVKNFDLFRKEGRGLYAFSGTKGSGKTFLMSCIANEILRTHDIPTKFITATEYIELVREKNESAKEKIRQLMNAALLILDDIGATAEDKGWISDALFRLVNFRHENLLPTLYTSNVEMHKLKCDERIISRIEQDCIPLMMPEVNIRRKKAEKSNAEFLRRVLAEE